MIVVDLGSMTWGSDESAAPLIDRFMPAAYFGFDPHPEAQEGAMDAMIFARRAAWIYDGFVDFREAGIRSGIPAQPGTTASVAPCFNFGSFLAALPPPVVVKMDIEGGEYPLLADLYNRGLDDRISLLLVEWHDLAYTNGWTVEKPPLRCNVEDWL